MTGRLSSLLAVVSLVSSAILASGCVFVVDRGPDQDATFHYHSSHLNRRFEVWGAGQVTFADDDWGVAHIAPGGFLHVEERRGFRTRRVRVEPITDGGVQVTHIVNGRGQPDDVKARDELVRLFLRAIRRTGIGAEARVGRLLADGGADRVFEDLAAFESSTAVSRYLTAMLAQATLTTADLIEMADRATTRIRSSGTRASFLIDAMPYFPSGAAQEAYFKAVDSIHSSGSRARVLVGVFDRDELDASTTVAALRSTTRITANGSKTRVLMAAVDHYRGDPEIRDAFFDAVDSVTSSGDHARALVAFVDGGHLDEPAMMSLTRSVDTISSSGAQARVLVAASDQARRSADLRAAHIEAAKRIQSDGERRRALGAMGPRESEA